MSPRPRITVERRKLAVALEERFIEVSYVVHEPTGARRTVLCIPDLMGNAIDFARLAATLARHGYRVLCPDLPGRGQSAYLDPADYNPHTYMTVLSALIETIASGSVSVIGKGWGAVLALGLAQLPEASISAVIVADLGFPWTAEIDDEISAAAKSAPFAGLTEARHLLAGSAEFRGLSPLRLQPLVDGRLRQLDAGYGFDFDPAILSSEAITRFSRLNTGPLFEGLTARILYMAASRVPKEQRGRMRATLGAAPNRNLVENVSRAARVHFVSTHELLVVLGFLMSRFLPAD